MVRDRLAVADGPSPVSGVDAASALSETLGQVTGLLSYLKAEVGPVAGCAPKTHAGIGDAVDGAWLLCEDLVTDPDWLGEIIARTGRIIGTEDQMVASSIFIQGYAYRLLALAVACLTVGGVVPRAKLDQVAVGLGRGRVSKVAYLEPVIDRLGDGEPARYLSNPEVIDHALGLIIEGTIEGHLRPLIAATRCRVRVGERLLWGNVAASGSTAFRTMEGSLGRWIEPLGQRFFELVPPELDGLGSYLMIEKPDGRHGWFWERTNCCLFYRIEGQEKCSDCSLTPATERRAAYEEGLQG
jgi:ferric iron reductase protein FhuF